MSLAYQQAFDSPEPAEPVTGELVLFTCPRHAGNLRLTEAGCVRMWHRAQKADLEIDVAMVHCRTCAIGASHAGMKCKPPDPVSCVRCETRATRLIGKLLCASCANRQMEIIRGRNARGRQPSRFQALSIYDYNDKLIVAARDESEAGRVVARMRGSFKSELLVDYGVASPSEISDWWHRAVMPWSSQIRRRHEFQLIKSKNTGA